ncbi:LysR family transcriptional regulator [Roseibium sp.]|uniref:LysR family transcriptional regulator n=2 Tax=Roseibium sp. TaxID=1936156 RepID=UPI00326427CE
MFDDIALFVHIVQKGSLARTAAHLGVPAATVTRRLRKLEERTGAKLLHRSARKFALTSEGEAFYEAFADLIGQAEANFRGLSADLHALQGGLKVAAPTNISVGILQPMWSGFIRAFPDIRLTLTLNNENKDLLENHVDLALRIGPQTDLRLFQRRLGGIATTVVASPDYLKAAGTPLIPDDLAGHSLIKVAALQSWELENTLSGDRETLHLNAFVTVDDIGLARQFAADGHGLALLPVSEISGDLQSGRLRRVLTGWRGPGRDIFAVWPTGRLLSARAKCLREYMAAFLNDCSVFQGAMPGADGP